MLVVFTCVLNISVKFDTSENPDTLNTVLWHRVKLHAGVHLGALLQIGTVVDLVCLCI